MSCSKNPDSSSSSSPSQTHQTPSSVPASKPIPHQTFERESKRIKTGEAEFKPVQALDISPQEEEQDESSEEEYDPDEQIILFPDTSNGNEEYDDVTFLRYIRTYEKQADTVPLPININEPQPTRYDMGDLLLFIERQCRARYADFSRCRFRNKIIKMQNKYREIVQEKGENPTVQDFGTPLGKLHFNLMKEAFVWED